MNQTDLGNKNNSMGIYKEKAYNFLNGLGAYFAIVLTSISILILLTISLGLGASDRSKGLLPFLIASAVLLTLYSITTTRTVNRSIKYRIMQVFKRIADIVGSSVLLFFMAPLFVLLGTAISIESSGPILYRYIHIGQFGKPFGVLKFRTMYVAPQKGMTKIGRFLRRFSLNELPILYNVLVGELSLVGPRPRSSEKFAKAINNESKIVTVKPGVTGLWQVSGVSEEKEIELDLQYIENWSLVLDIKIFFKTILMVLFNSESA
jgi:lipopolysaccharide/colanic/teichoic acid biosynthesis glycosyltransferase